MPFNGSGVFQRVRNWVADATAGTKIRADLHDSEDDGFAAGLSNCITKDGQTVVTQNIPFNNKRITGLADPVNPQDAATNAQINQVNLSLQTLVEAIAGKVSKAGDGMTGDLVLPGNAVSALRFQLWADINKFSINSDGNSMILHGEPGTFLGGFYGIDFQNGTQTASWASIGSAGMRIAGVLNVTGAITSAGVPVTLKSDFDALLARIEALENKGAP